MKQLLEKISAKLGAINDAVVHQNYIDEIMLPPNILLMNRYTHSSIEQDNRHTIEKVMHKPVYTFSNQATYKDFQEAFIQQIVGGNNELYTRTSR